MLKYGILGIPEDNYVDRLINLNVDRSDGQMHTMWVASFSGL